MIAPSFDFRHGHVRYVPRSGGQCRRRRRAGTAAGGGADRPVGVDGPRHPPGSAVAKGPPRLSRLAVTRRVGPQQRASGFEGPR